MTKNIFIYLMIGTGFLACCAVSGQPVATEAGESSPFLSLTNGDWKILVSRTDGAVTEISNPSDATGMNWVHAKRPWGLLELGSGANNVIFNRPASVQMLDARVCETVYETDSLKLTVRRSIDAQDRFAESYTLKNTGTAPSSFAPGSTFLTVPFNDSYQAGAPTCLTQNCNAHLWPGGGSSWANAVRMGGMAPHLGLVLTQGSLDGYSILGGVDSNERGEIAFNSSGFELKPGESYVIAWQLFWNQGWPDFWSKAVAETNFVRLQAAHYTVVQGGQIQISAESASSLQNAVLRLNGNNVTVKHRGNRLFATVKANQLGEQTFELENQGRRSWLKANVIADPLALIQARVKFIVAKQQRNETGSPLDGAYLAFDNETGRQVIDGANDHNAARERVGMGVLVALYIPLCKDAELKQQLLASAERYEAFIQREIQDTNGVVYGNIGYRDSYRLYDAPWVADLHLAMYWATHDQQYLDLYVKNIQAYYGKNHGVDFRFFPIEQWMLDGLRTLRAAGRTADYDKVLEDFTNHANTLAKIGRDYPKSEVNYEQSIVAPGVQIELEMYLATRHPRYLASAKEQLPCLEAFDGEQPDYHLNDIAIRHWDDYWFGKIGLNGDTMPHYWSTLTALAFDEYATATGEESYHRRAEDILLNNLCPFKPDGRASCAYLYPLKIGAQEGQRFDPWANDQDWALVNWLTFKRWTNGQN